jgi:hypothetical protein
MHPFFRSPDGAQRNPGAASELIVPGFRSTHPGYACLQRLIWMPIGPTADFI